MNRYIDRVEVDRSKNLKSESNRPFTESNKSLISAKEVDVNVEIEDNPKSFRYRRKSNKRLRHDSTSDHESDKGRSVQRKRV